MRCGACGVCEFRAGALQNEAQWRVAAPSSSLPALKAGFAVEQCGTMFRYLEV